MVVVAVDDLLFASRIRAAAKGLDVPLTFARTPDAIAESVREHAPTLLIIDLNAERMSPIDTIRRLRADPTTTGVRVVGYVAHVDTPVIAAAHAAGADHVMARSQFVAQLAALLEAAR